MERCPIFRLNYVIGELLSEDMWWLFFLNSLDLNLVIKLEDIDIMKVVEIFSIESSENNHATANLHGFGRNVCFPARRSAAAAR